MKAATFFIPMFSLIIQSNDVTAVINGGEADQSDYKYMVSLWYHNRYACGGAILDETHVLTAAHCFQHDPCPLGYTILAGAQSLSESLPKIQVMNIQIRRGFEPADMEKLRKKRPLGHPTNDIAVVTLEEKLTFTDKIDKVERPKPTDKLPFLCDQCIFTGWGASVKGKKNSDKLRHTILSIIPRPQCTKLFGKYRDNELCALDLLEETGPASGDSGSPLVCNGFIYAVHSTSRSDPQRPAIMSNVIEHLDFIEDALKN